MAVPTALHQASRTFAFLRPRTMGSRTLRSRARRRHLRSSRSVPWARSKLKISFDTRCVLGIVYPCIEESTYFGLCTKFLRTGKLGILHVQPQTIVVSA